MSIRLDNIRDPKLRQRIEAAARRCPRCDLHGGPGYIDPTCLVCRGKGTVERDWATGGGAEKELITPIGYRPLLNKTEQRWCNILEGRGFTVMRQAITLALSPPFKSYRPDLAVFEEGRLVLWEVKAKHRFREKGIAKAALAAKTYPQLRFKLADWTGAGWKESVLSP